MSSWAAMTASADAHDRALVAGRLRAAGCVFAEDEADVLLASARSAAELDEMTAARVSGLPLEHVVGWAEFCGLRVAVDRGVFVPRRRSELVVRAAARRLRPGAVVVDMCCGCGALGLAVASAVPSVRLHAVDVDDAAVACARRNLAGVGGSVYQGDLFAVLPDELRGRVDVMLANAPYVPTDEVALMPPEARDHEPLAALDGGPDGLDVHRRIITGTAEWLVPGGRLIVETSRRQAGTDVALLTAAGYTATVEHDPDLDATVVRSILE
jgi:release factor glutamine methyltransferase